MRAGVVAVLVLSGWASGQSMGAGWSKQSGSATAQMMMTASNSNLYCTPAGAWIGAATDGPAALPVTCNYTAAAATPTATWRAACPAGAGVTTHNANAAANGKCWVGNPGDLIPAGDGRAGQSVDYYTVQDAMTSAAGNCGIWFNLLPTSDNTPSGTPRVYSENVTLPANTGCDAADWNWVTSGNYAGLPDENTRINPGYMGIASLPGRPSYSGPAVAGVYVPKIVGTLADTGTITIDPSTAYWRFVGLELTDANGVHNTGPIVDFPPGAYGQLDVVPCNATQSNKDANGNTFTGCSPGNTAGYYVTGSGGGFSGAVGQAGAAVLVNNFATTVLSSPDSSHAVLSGSLPGMFPQFSGTVNTIPCTGTDTPNVGCVANGAYVTRVSGDSFGGSGNARWSWANNTGQKYIAINGQNWYLLKSNGVIDGDHLVVTTNAGTQNGVGYYLPPAFNANPSRPADIVYDRLLVHGGNDPQWQNAAAVSAVGISLKGNNVSVINSYIGDLWCGQSSPSAGITGASYAGTTTTLNVASTAGFALNQSLTVSGVTPSAYNGTFTITALNASAGTVSYTQASNPGAYSSGGTAKVTLTQCVEAKAIAAGTGATTNGSIKIVNNFLESSSENLFMGGATSAGSVHDLEVRRNHLFKPLFWNKFCVNPQAGVVSTSGSAVTRTSGVYFRPEWTSVTINGTAYTVTAVTAQNSMTVNPAPGTLSGANLAVSQLPNYCQGIGSDGINRNIKNNLEFKQAVRSLIEGNVLENDWEGQSDQFGEMLHLNVMQNSNDGLPGTTITDTTVRYNLLAHGNKGMVLANAGYSAGPLPGGVGRISIHGNLFDDINNTKWGLSSGGQPQTGSTCVVTNNALSGPWTLHDISFDHNTCVQSSAGGIPAGTEQGSLWGWNDYTNATPAMAGTVNIALGTNAWWAVTSVSGSQFPVDGSLVGQDIQIGSNWYQVMYVKSPTVLYLAPGANVGTQSGAAWWSQCQSGSCANGDTAATLWPGIGFTNNIAAHGINPGFTGLGPGSGTANAIAVNSGTGGWCFGPNLVATRVLNNETGTIGYPSAQGGSGCPSFGVGNVDTSDHTFGSAGFTAFTDGGWTGMAGGGNDYRLTAGSPGSGAGSDGRDLGADMGVLVNATSSVQ